MKKVGQTEIKPVHRGSCHCGGVVFEVDLPDGIVDPRRCNCSICRRKGAIMAGVPEAGLRILKGNELLREYRFHSKVAQHFFCSVCGIYTHHRRRMNPKEFGFNLGCLEGVNPYELGEVPVNDGVHHPADRKAGA